MIQIKRIGEHCHRCDVQNYGIRRKRAIVGNYNCRENCVNKICKIGNFLICWK